MLKKLIFIGVMLSSFGLICWIFWTEEFSLYLPEQKSIEQNELKALPKHLAKELKIKEVNKPLILHFYNPKCQCSKFNWKEFETLAKEYSNDINCIVFIEKNKLDSSEFKGLNEKFKNVQFKKDYDGYFAEQFNIQKTPQAIVIDTDQKIIYQGNYNIARFCTNQQTSYVKKAIAMLMKETTYNPEELIGMKTYGCQIKTN